MTRIVTVNRLENRFLQHVVRHESEGLIRVAENLMENLGLYEGAKRPKCNPDFTSEIGANDLILRPALYR